MSKIHLIAFLALTAAQPILTGCGPTQAQIDPRNVADLKIRPANGQALFCPGAAFGVEFVAKLKDGSMCSNLNADSGCMNQKNTVIDPTVLRLSGNNGQVQGQGWVTDADPLKTADTGIRLRGWLEQVIGGQNQKSMEAEMDMKPVYECRNSVEWGPNNGRDDGSNGASAPSVTIAVTTLSTPFYPDAALVRVEHGTSRDYYVSPSSDKPIRIYFAGQAGARGMTGTSGSDGKPGDAGAECKDGTNGTDGTAGGPGGRGGNGGAGATIKVILDEANADKLRGRLLIANPGGAAGEGGYGGQGGRGGAGGAAGTKPAQNPPADCNPKAGTSGQNGSNGANGPRGNAGPNGPPPAFENGKRQVVWANELQSIQRIEGAGGRAK